MIIEIANDAKATNIKINGTVVFSPVLGLVVFCSSVSLLFSSIALLSSSSSSSSMASIEPSVVVPIVVSVVEIVLTMPGCVVDVEDELIIGVVDVELVDEVELVELVLEVELVDEVELVELVLEVVLVDEVELVELVLDVELVDEVELVELVLDVVLVDEVVLVELVLEVELVDEVELVELVLDVVLVVVVVITTGLSLIGFNKSFVTQVGFPFASNDSLYSFNPNKAPSLILTVSSSVVTLTVNIELLSLAPPASSFILKSVKVLSVAGSPPSLYSVFSGI